MEKIEKIVNKYWFFLIIILSIPAIWALFVKGYYGASDDLHIGWLFEMDRIIKLGQIPPRYVPDLSFGFGYPLFNFIFPLPFYIGEIFHLLGFSFVDSIKAVFFVSLPLSGMFMYSFLKKFTIPTISLAGALLYIFTPYRSVDIYVRGAIGEVVSFVFLPLIALSVVNLHEGKKAWIGIGGLSLAGLILSHNIVSYMFFPFLILFICFQIFFASKKIKLSLNFLSMIFLGLILSMYFWFPAIKDSTLMKYDTVFNFADHYLPLKKLVTPYWGYGGSNPTGNDGMSFFLGFANLFALTLGLIASVFNWKIFSSKQKGLILWATLGFFSAVFLMNYRSVLVWEKIPFLPYFQFPWRFLTLTTFFIPIFLVAIGKAKFQYIFLFLILVLILPTLSYFRPQDFLGREDNYYLNRYIPYPVASNEYLKTQEEYLRLPKDTKIRPNEILPIVFPQEELLVKKIDDLRFLINYESSQSSELNVSKYNFSGWTARIDGKTTQISSGEPYGQINFLIPAGKHNVEVKFEETRFKKILDFASLMGFLVSLWMVKSLWSRSKKTGFSL